MSNILNLLNKFLGCLPVKTKTEKEYITEIFDAIDTDGNQYLDKDELVNIWNFIKSKRISILNNDIINYRKKKLEEIENIKNGTPKVLLDSDDSLHIDKFIRIIRSLNLNDNELKNLWKNIKRDEIINIQNEINKLNN
tara:strand:- start:23 stop:436 length:414 start_codon:yes stop_codon:yes gene_type:complete